MSFSHPFFSQNEIPTSTIITRVDLATSFRRFEQAFLSAELDPKKYSGFLRGWWRREKDLPSVIEWFFQFSELGKAQTIDFPSF